MILWAAGHRSWNHPHWTNHTRVIPWTSSVFFPLIWHSVKECISASNISESVCQEKETPKEKKKVVLSLTSVYPVWSHLSSFLLWHKYCLNDEDNVHAYEEQMYKRKEAPCACFSLGLGEITGTSRCYLWVSTWAHWGSILQGDRPFLSTVRAKKKPRESKESKHCEDTCSHTFSKTQHSSEMMHKRYDCLEDMVQVKRIKRCDIRA